MSQLGSTARWLALLALAVHLLQAGSHTLERSIRWGLQGLETVPWDLATGRRAALGDRWVESIDALRRAIPRDGEYVLVNAGPERSGAALWVRFELAPRRARNLGNLTGLRSALDPRLAGLDPATTWAVIAFPEPAPPKLLRLGELIQALGSGNASR